MNIIYTHLVLIASITSLSCCIPGNFLVLRGTSLLSDAIGHAILLGIVLGFLITNNIHSPLIFISAIIIGLFTALGTEILISTKRIQADAAIGLMFPLLFSIAILLISKYANDIHIDTDAAMLGELAFTPFHPLIIGDTNCGPIALWTMSLILCCNIINVILWYPALKVTTFNSDYAYTLGYRPYLIHYGLMSMTSLTIVGAFETAGAILVVALMIIPPSTAYLITNRLSHMIIISALFALISTISGCLMAHALHVSITGSIATCNGFIFFITLIIKNIQK